MHRRSSGALTTCSARHTRWLGCSTTSNHGRGKAPDRRPAVAQLARWIVILVRDEGQGLEADQRRDAEGTIERMIARFGYCRECAADAASLLVRKRFNDLV